MPKCLLAFEAFCLRAVITTIAFGLVVKRTLHFNFSPLPNNARSYLAAVATLSIPVLVTC
ncbi:MAG: hypothetical protein ACR2H6_05325 [Pyrinomonadaceae bacterium]